MLAVRQLSQQLADYLQGKPTAPRSPQWSEVRRAWLKDHPVCASCGCTDNLEVHHIQAFHMHPELELVSTNFVTLCEGKHECHLRVGHSYNWQCINPHSVEDAALQLQRIRERQTH